MNGMTPPRSRTPGLGAAWAVLIGTGITSVTYNVVHAVPVLELALALLLGFAPAFVAACLSHVAAVLDAPWWVKSAVIAVMLGGMVLSASNTAAVVAPAEPGWRGWLFGIVLDAGALLALWAIMASRRHKNDTATEAEAAMAAAQNEAAQATQRAAELDAQLVSLQAELASVRTELEAEVQALRSALNKALNKRRTSPPNRRSGSAPKPAVPSDVDTQAEALRILGEEPDISGQELGRRLGKSERYGCILRNRLAPSMPGPDAPK